MTLTCLFLKRKLNSIPLQQQKWKNDFQFLTLLSTKQLNTLVQNSFDKLMQLTSMELNIYDLDRDEKTDLHKFLKKLHNVVLS